MRLVPFRDNPSPEQTDSDLDPVLRQLLTRADDFFGVLFVLTLPDELTWSQVSK